MPQAGYSTTPLVKKLGIKPGAALRIMNPPPDYDQTLGPLPDNVDLRPDLDQPLDFIQLFTDSHADLETQFPRLKAALARDGMLWISWPKKASKVPTDVTETVVREVGLANGLVDVKVAAIDQIWSGLKFVFRLEDR